MSKIYSPRMVGTKMGLTHQDVIRRLRRGDIAGQKMGWNWVITEEALQKAMESDWFKRLLSKRDNSTSTP